VSSCLTLQQFHTIYTEQNDSVWRESYLLNRQSTYRFTAFRLIIHITKDLIESNKVKHESNNVTFQCENKMIYIGVLHSSQKQKIFAPSKNP